MWSTDTLWFEVAIVTSITTVGGILLGHFEEHKPKWRRLLKVALVIAVVVAVSATAGRAWALGLLVVPAAAAAYVHLRWLPRHGVDGWTGEPRERYLELVTRSKKGEPR